MKNTVVHEFDPVIYPYKLWVIVGKSNTMITEMFFDYDGEPIEDLTSYINKVDAFVMPVCSQDCGSYGVVVCFRSKKSMTASTIAHEASHASKYLFDHIRADVSAHEPFEYVLGWMVECIDKVKHFKAPSADVK